MHLVGCTLEECISFIHVDENGIHLASDAAAWSVPYIHIASDAAAWSVPYIHKMPFISELCLFLSKYYSQILLTSITHKYYSQMLITNITHKYYSQILLINTTHKYYAQMLITNVTHKY